MEPNVVAWFMLCAAGISFTVWLLWKMYEHDYNKIHKDENKFDYWS